MSSFDVSRPELRRKANAFFAARIEGRARMRLAGCLQASTSIDQHVHASEQISGHSCFAGAEEFPEGWSLDREGEQVTRGMCT